MDMDSILLQHAGGILLPSTLEDNRVSATASTTSSKITFGPRWRGGLVVGRRTCDLVVAGSRPSRDAAAPQP